MSATSRAGRATAGGATAPAAPHWLASHACGATVAGCRLELGMSEQRLNHAKVRTALEQMGREAVAKRMQRNRLAQPRGFGGLLEQPAELTRGQWLMLTATWKQPALFRRKAGVI